MQRNKQIGNADFHARPPYLIKLMKSILPEEIKLFFSVPESSLFLDGQTEVMNNVYNHFQHSSQLKRIFQDFTKQWSHVQMP